MRIREKKYKIPINKTIRQKKYKIPINKSKMQHRLKKKMNKLVINRLIMNFKSLFLIRKLN